ncbi:proline racemase [Deferribacter desulfuricans SSM1]|uniref:Proline racemase n=1 Tax=Deferribacter desulfuricans (strain DSM 14783 / JCM 11476 / NBRC 101012 / SSM1) TaxID=639282 RepID=D3P8P9_DEFDS|nr:proline racemase family protein [Deferribacter desulfuricans]BAI81089.1 proline racemase [Deferribacter desulfuricans SSM1]
MWGKEKFDEFKIDKNKGLAIKTIDLHTGGEPLRVIYDGIPDIKANSVLEFRRIMKENYDYIRETVILEPRGHADMYGAILLPPYREGVDFGVIFLHNEGYSTMCGHGIIALIKLAYELKLIDFKEPITEIKIDTPAGIVTAFAEISDGKLDKYYFRNVPSFIYKSNCSVYIDGLGDVVFDIAFGGAYYAYVNVKNLNISLDKENVQQLINLGRKIKMAVMNKCEIKHPEYDDLSFLYGVIFYDGNNGKDKVSKNVCIFADGEVDRSPTGTGVSGRMALHYFKNEIQKDDEIVVESIVGSKFKGRIYSVVDFYGYKSVIPEVEGKAHIIGKNEFFVDNEDEIKYGFFMR